MVIGLRELIQQQQQLETGTTVEEGEGVSIAPAAEGEETKITTSAGDAGITVSEEVGTGTPLVTIGDGESVRSVTNVINETDPNNSELLATVAAINSRINAAVSGSLAYEPLHSKADFDTFLAALIIAPSIVLVTDTVAFDYTDTNGLETTGMTWWLGMVSKPSGQALDSDTLFTSESQSSLTGVQISSALYALADHNQLTDAMVVTINSIEQSLADGLATKVDKVVGKGLSKNDLTDALLALINNLPADTLAELSNKLSLNSSGVNVVIDNPGTGNGYILFRNSAAPVDQQDFKMIARSDGTWDFEALNDDGSLQTRFTLTHGGDFNVPSQITQNGNNVVDVTYSKLVNAPADTNAEISALQSGKVDKDGSKVLTDVNFSQADKDHLDSLGDGDFNGGEITNPLVVKSDSRAAIVLKAVSNAATESGFAVQNTGNNYTLNMHRENTATSNDWLFKLGSNADINALPECVRLSDGAITATFKGGVHADGDIFAFNGGNMAAADITAVGSLISPTYRWGTSASLDYNLAYVATQGNSNSPKGNKAADGKSFSGNALRLRVPNQTSQGFMVENGAGLNLLEVNGSTGIAYTASQLNTGGSIFFPRNSRVGRTVANHSTANNGTVQYGSIVGSTFTGMEITTTHNGTHNKEVIDLYTHDGGNSAGRRVHIGADGRSFFQQSLLIGSNAYPSYTLQVVGDAKISGNTEFNSKVTVTDTLVIEDKNDDEYRIRSNSISGIEIRAMNNPANSDPLVQILSSGGGVRLWADQSRMLATGNPEMRVGINTDGSGGRLVLEEGNWAILQRQEGDFQNNPNVTQTDVVNWSGRSKRMYGVGDINIPMPAIVTSDPASNQMLVGERFRLDNFNSSSVLRLNMPSGVKFMIDNVSGVSATAATFILAHTSECEIVAEDLRGYSQVNAFCYTITARNK